MPILSPGITYRGRLKSCVSVRIGPYWRGLLHGAFHGDDRTAGNTITTMQQAMVCPSGKRSATLAPAAIIVLMMITLLCHGVTVFLRSTTSGGERAASSAR